jgi:hypothetical protein
MSLLQCPDGILLKFAMLVAAQQQFEDDLLPYIKCSFPELPLIWCDTRGVWGLSLSCHRLRQVSIPILFSSVTVLYVRGLMQLIKVLPFRKDIAVLIR